MLYFTNYYCKMIMSLISSYINSSSDILSKIYAYYTDITYITRS